MLQLRFRQTLCNELYNRDIVEVTNVGDSQISVADEKLSYEYISKMLKENPYICAIMPEGETLTEEYIYGDVTTM